MKQSERVLLPVIEWQPTDDRVLIRRFETEKRTPSGLIVIPDTAQEKAYKGIVLACGESVYLDDSKNYEPRKGKYVVPGDVILFGKYAGSEIEVFIDGQVEELLVMRVADIIAVRDKNIWDESRKF